MAKQKTKSKPPAKALARAPAKVSKPKTASAGEEITVPIGAVVVAKENPRHGQPVADLEEITATMRAHGQLQRMIAYKDGAKWATTDGARRLAGMLAAELKSANLIVFGKDEAIKRGLAAQVERVNLHPAAEAVEFAKLLKRGDDAKTVAAEFGKSERYVLQRQKLADLHPPILKALANDEIDINTAEAWAIAPSTRQASLWKRMGGARAGIRWIQEELKKGKVQATEPLAKFVGVEAYEAAGGKVERDLFGFRDEDDPPEVGEASSVWLEDADKLNELAAAKIDEAAKKYGEEGWGWVEFHEDGKPYGYVTAQGKAPTQPAARAKVGVVLSLSEKTGQLVVEKNITTYAAMDAARRAKDKKDTGRTKTEVKPDYTGAAFETATTVVSLAVARALAADPRAAMTALLAQLAREVFMDFDTYGDKALQVDGRAQIGGQDVKLLSDETWEKLHEKQFALLKPGAKDLEAHIDDLSDLQRAGLTGFLVAACFGFTDHAMPGHDDPPESHKQLATLGRIAGAKLADHWLPSADFLKGLSKPALQEACKELGIEAPEKKGAMAEAVAIAAADKGWTPPLMRQLAGEVAKAKPKARAKVKKAKRRK